MAKRRELTMRPLRTGTVIAITVVGSVVGGLLGLCIAMGMWAAMSPEYAVIVAGCFPLLFFAVYFMGQTGRGRFSLIDTFAIFVGLLCLVGTFVFMQQGENILATVPLAVDPAKAAQFQAEPLKWASITSAIGFTMYWFIGVMIGMRSGKKKRKRF
jgi:hypothetical protein